MIGSERRDAQHTRELSVVYARMERMAGKKNILIRSEHRNQIIRVLEWFSDFYDINKKINLIYLVAVLQCMMKNNREEYEDDMYNPEPFKEVQETEDIDISSFRNMIVIDEEDLLPGDQNKVQY